MTLLGAIETAIVAHNRSSGRPPLADTVATTTTSGALPPRLRAPRVVAEHGRLGREFR